MTKEEVKEEYKMTEKPSIKVDKAARSIHEKNDERYAKA